MSATEERGTLVAANADAAMADVAMRQSGPDHDQTVVVLGDRYVVVVAETVNMFIVDDDGERYPVGRAAPGTIITALTNAPKVIATPHGGAALVPVTSELAEQLDVETGLRKWQYLIANYMSAQEAAESVVACDLRDLPTVIGPCLRDELERRNDLARAALVESRRLDEIEVRKTRNRNAATVRNPLERQTMPNRSLLFTVMQHIGGIQGFKPVDVRTRDYSEASVRAVARSANLKARAVRLRGDWVRYPTNPLLGFIGTREQVESGTAEPVAIVPRMGRYYVYRPDNPDRKMNPVTGDIADRLYPVAWEFTLPLPMDREVRYKDLVRLGFKMTSGMWLTVVGASLAVSLLALASPALTQLIMETIVPMGNEGLLISIGVGLALAALVGGAFSVVQSLTVASISQRGQLRVQAAVWDRTLAMPPTFFKQFSSGDLMGRVLAASDCAQIVSSSMISQVLGAAFSLVSFILLLQYSVALSLMTVAILLITVVAIAVVARSLRKTVASAVSSQRIATSWIVQLLTGISKIRVAGAEARLVAQHEERIRGIVDYSAQETLVTNRLRSFFVGMNALVTAATFLVIYFFDWSSTGSQISPATYMAFAAAFGIVYGAVSSLSNLVIPLITSTSTLRMAKPILGAIPENAKAHDRPGRVYGGYEFSHVSFRYNSGLPLVLHDISLQIAPGEFVAIVGPSGSGKSTLVRLLLGFEHPSDGQVLFDGRNLAELDLQEVRSNLGVVLQNGQLMSASILDNILAGMPLSESVAWQAAEKAALADDIRAMPMGMQTRIDSNTVSGGQAQRILLARALVRQPPVVILDEATSAMDNESQATVTASLRELGSTRVVVAHRLSTVRDADRILVVKDGEIAEEGTYDELLAAGGVFTELARRQLVSMPEQSTASDIPDASPSTPNADTAAEPVPASPRRLPAGSYWERLHGKAPSGTAAPVGPQDDAAGEENDHRDDGKTSQS